MGFAFALGPCYCCKGPFTFNPRKVPSYQGEPICKACMERINEEKKAAGVEPFPIPKDAYEPIDEHAL